MVLIGAVGWHSELLYQCIPEFFMQEREYYGVDNDPAKHGQTWRGIPIISYAQAKRFVGQNPICLVSSYASQQAIVQQFMDIGCAAHAIYTLYDHPGGY